MYSSREDIASLIFEKLNLNKGLLKKQFCLSKESIGFFYLDDLLPYELVLKIMFFYKKFLGDEDYF